MPTYEYECRTCGEKFDVFQSIKAAVLRKTECENCGGVQPVRRLVGTGGAILFKGSGFYQTDYRSESYKKAAKADKGPGDSGGKPAKSDDAKNASATSGLADKKADSSVSGSGKSES